MQADSHTTRSGICIRGLVIWLVIIVAEIFHGIARAVVLVPIVGEFRSNQIGVFSGSIIILVIAWLSIRWVGASRHWDLIMVGTLWLVLTVAFEVLFGRLVMNLSWQRLLANYNVLRGGLMPIGLVVLFFSTCIASKIRLSTSTKDIRSPKSGVDVAIHPEEPHDWRAIRHVNQAAFDGDTEADLVESLRDGGFVEVSLVADMDEEIVGHILFSRVSIVTDAGTVTALSLAPMAVVPSHQRKAVGSKLLEHGLEQCRAHGHRIVVVLGHPNFYSRFGFSSELATSLESPFGGGKPSMALELVPDSMTGIDGRVEYSPPFRSLE